VKGATYKRCTCPVRRGPDGKPLLSRKKHGSWFFAHDVPRSGDCRLHQIRVGVFASEREAREAMQPPSRAWLGVMRSYRANSV